MPTKKCPHCAEEIQEQAIKCKHCKSDLKENSEQSQSSSASSVKSFDSSNILQMKSSLDAKQLLLFQTEFDKRKKSVGYAYVLYFLLGGLGGHAFYVDRRGSGFAYLLCTIFGFSLIMNERPEMRALGGFLLLTNAIHALYDLFTLASQTRKANEKTEKDILIKFLASNA